jgi:hypothetical protein
MQRYKHPTGTMTAIVRAGFIVAAGIFGAALILGLGGCATTVSPLVRLEQGLTSSLDVTQAVVQIDYDQAAPCRALGVPVAASCSQLEATIPGAHKVANDVRTLYPPAVQAGNATVDVYRQALAVQAALAASSTATAEQKAAATAAVTAALAKANAALVTVAIYVAEAQTVYSGWKGPGK